MSASKSAEKQRRAAEKRRLRNKSAHSQVKTMVTKAQKLISAGDPGTAKEAAVAAISALDRAAGKRIIHPNSAARRKSRLSTKLAALSRPGGKKPA
ncbi:MAG: 30S ribosomal protein S20 [Chloroflexota bacterium]